MGRIIHSGALTLLLTLILLLLFAWAVPSGPITQEARDTWLEETVDDEYDFL